MAETAKNVSPKLIIAGGSAYPRELDFGTFRAVADEVGAVLLVDMAHWAGLVAAGFHADPLPHADVVTATTYKNLRGVRGGFILSGRGETWRASSTRRCFQVFRVRSFSMRWRPRPCALERR